MTRSRSGRCFGAAFILVVAAAIAAACWLFWPAQREAAPPIDSVHASAERGRYLATIGNCTSCHTARDGKPFAGGVSFHTPFGVRSEEHTSELQSLMRISYAVFCSKKKKSYR